MAISIVEIGEETLDSQHDNLLLWFCRLERAQSENVEEGIIDELLAGLSRYVEEHFAYEEALMSRIGYPGIAAHQAEHGAFCQRLKQVATGREEGEPLGDELFALLKGWIIEHINRADAGIGLYLDPAFSQSPLKRSLRLLS